MLLIVCFLAIPGHALVRVGWQTGHEIADSFLINVDLLTQHYCLELVQLFESCAVKMRLNTRPNVLDLTLVRVFWWPIVQRMNFTL